MPQSLTQELYNNLTPKEKKSLKSSSSWLIEEEVFTNSTSARDQKVTLIGESEAPGSIGIQLDVNEEGLSSGALVTGDKNDTIIGSGALAGIGLNSGTRIETGGGNDTLNGEGGFYGIFLGNTSTEVATIETGSGNDSINGSGPQAGISVLFESEIDTGSGNDSITGISGGVLGGLSGGIGIQLGGLGEGDGFIDTGDGNDSVTGVGANTGISLSSGSSLSTGDGEDTVNALNGGFGGSGTIDLGADDDTLIGGGFGSGILFDGGDGGGDKIVLGEGIYFYNGSDLYKGSDDSGDKMNIENFELISGVAGAVLSSDSSTFVDDPTLNPNTIYTVNNEGFLLVV